MILFLENKNYDLEAWRATLSFAWQYIALWIWVSVWASHQNTQTSVTYAFTVMKFFLENLWFSVSIFSSYELSEGVTLIWVTTSSTPKTTTIWARWRNPSQFKYIDLMIFLFPSCSFWKWSSYLIISGFGYFFSFWSINR